MVSEKKNVCVEFQALCALIENRNFEIIGIDGADGVGKSCLAKQVATEFNFGHIEVDCFLYKNQGAYLKSVDSDSLKLAIDEVRVKHQAIVMDGVCLKAVLECIEVVADFHIYVQTISEEGIVQNSDIIDHEVDPEPCRNISCLSALDQELVKYHAAYRPQARSDVVYQRTIA